MLSASSSRPHPTSEQPPRGVIGATISAVSNDVVRSHILSRLDGASLAALSSASAELHSLCADEPIWREKCAATWRSVFDPRVQRVISTLPSGHRSFFSDSYPLLDLRRGVLDPQPSDSTRELISAVDIYYKGEVILSKVQETETVSGWFLCSPFRVDLLDPKESVPTRIPYDNQWDDYTWVRHVEENLSLSWVLIDPTRKRSGNVSSRRPVSVHRHWLTGEVHVRFSTVLAGNRRGKKASTELVEFAAEVVMAPAASGVEVREVSLVAEDMEGRNLGGEGSLVILAAAMGGRRRRGGGEERYMEFRRRKKAAAEREETRRRRSSTAVDTAACVIAGGAAMLVGFWLCMYLCIRQKLATLINKFK